MENNLADKDYQCTLCYEVFHYPVTLPCKHRFCKHCFDQHVENNGFTCPLCRARLSNWLRKLKLSNENIVDSKFWGIIQRMYPVNVENKNGALDEQFVPESSSSGNMILYTIKIAMKNKEKKIMEAHSNTEENIAHNSNEVWRGWPTPFVTECRDVLYQIIHGTASQKIITSENDYGPKLRLAEPGEIRQEYEEFLRKQREETIRQEEENMRLSEKLIRMIEEHEKQEQEERIKLIERQLKADEEIAKTLLEQESTIQPFEERLRAPATPRRRSRRQQISSDPEDNTRTRINKTSEDLHRSILEDSPPQIPQCVVTETDSLASTSTSSSVCCFTLQSNPRAIPTNIVPTCFDRPSTSKGNVTTRGNVFAKYFSGMSMTQNSSSSCQIGSPEVCTQSSTEASNTEATEKQATMSRCSSGADSIGQELNHFKPIRTSPTTPTKDGSSSWLPQVVVAHKSEMGQELSVNEEQEISTPTDVVLVLRNIPDMDLSAQDLEDSITLENQLEADRKLALELQQQWNSSESTKKKRNSIPLVKTDYNLRKRKKSSLRKKVLLDRTQATLDSMLIK